MAESPGYAVGDPLLLTRSTAPIMYTPELFGPHHVSIRPVRQCGVSPRVIRLVPVLFILLSAAGLCLLVRVMFPFQEQQLFTPLSHVPHTARVPRLAPLSASFPSLPDPMPRAAAPEGDRLGTGMVHLNTVQKKEDEFVFEYGSSLEQRLRETRRAAADASAHLQRMQTSARAVTEFFASLAEARALDSDDVVAGLANALGVAKSRGAEMSLAAQAAAAHAAEVTAAAARFAKEAAAANLSIAQLRQQEEATLQALQTEEAGLAHRQMEHGRAVQAVGDALKALEEARRTLQSLEEAARAMEAAAVEAVRAQQDGEAAAAHAAVLTAQLELEFISAIERRAETQAAVSQTEAELKVAEGSVGTTEAALLEAGRTVDELRGRLRRATRGLEKLQETLKLAAVRGEAVQEAAAVTREALAKEEAAVRATALEDLQRQLQDAREARGGWKASTDAARQLWGAALSTEKALEAAATTFRASMATFGPKEGVVPPNDPSVQAAAKLVEALEGAVSSRAAKEAEYSRVRQQLEAAEAQLKALDADLRAKQATVDRLREKSAAAQKAEADILRRARQALTALLPDSGVVTGVVWSPTRFSQAAERCATNVTAEDIETAVLYAREHVGLIQRETEAAVARAEAELRDVARPRLEAGERRLKAAKSEREALAKVRDNALKAQAKAAAEETAARSKLVAQQDELRASRATAAVRAEAAAKVEAQYAEAMLRATAGRGAVASAERLHAAATEREAAATATLEALRQHIGQLQADAAETRRRIALARDTAASKAAQSKKAEGEVAAAEEAAAAALEAASTQAAAVIDVEARVRQAEGRAARAMEQMEKATAELSRARETAVQVAKEVAALQTALLDIAE